MSANERDPLAPPVDREVDEELGQHLELRAREYEQRGLQPDAARRAALRRFGDLDAVRRDCRRVAAGRERDKRRREWLSELRQDTVFALRQLPRQPAFSLTAALTLALGIGATTAIFAAVHAVLLRPFAYREPERVVTVGTVWRGQPGGNVSAGNYVYAQDRTKSIRPLAAAAYTSMNLSGDDAPERVVGARVTHEFWEVFGVAPALGRVFGVEEDARGHDQVAVLSHGLWRRRYAADPAVIGREIRLGGIPHRVIGVMPSGFDPSADDPMLWKPMAFTPERRAMHDEHFLECYGRLSSGFELGQANDELRRVAESLHRDHPRDFPEDNSLRADNLADAVVGPSRQRLLLLLGAVALVLLIACANVANLLLARGGARARELATRAALGAGRARIVRQLLTESLVLAGLGALLGTALAQAALRGLLLIAPPNVPRLQEAQLDGAVLAFTIALALLSSLVFGAAPALQAARLDLRAGLIEGGRGSTLSRDRLRRALIAAEVALALMLLVGSGLLIRSSLFLQRLDPGFEPAGLLSARLSLPLDAYQGHERRMRVYSSLLERLAAAPGVSSVAASSQAPLLGGGSNGLLADGRVPDLRNLIQARSQFVTTGYFETLRIPLRRGRPLEAADRRGAPKVMVINEALARAAFPGQDPIGRRIACCEGGPDNPDWKEVVGVAADVRTRGPAQEVRPEFYLPLDQVPPEAWGWIQGGMTVLLRAKDGAPGALAPLVRQAVRELDPGLPVFDMLTMPERMARALSSARFSMLLTSAAGALGLALAVVGVYGVVAYFVSQRTREIGVRVALGASARDILGLVVGQGLRTVSAGIVVGLAGSLLLGRLLRGLLFGVGPADPLTLLSVAALLGAVAAAAAVVPALSAARVDPARVLSQG
jgi:predicted permease